MAGKKRSGFRNDLRAYGCICKNIQNTCYIQYIYLSNIATYNSLNKTWTLNKNTIITKCQTLILPDYTGQLFFVIDGFKLENYGLIYRNISASNLVNINILNNGSLINNNKITIGNTNFHVYNSGEFINDGYFLNTSYFYIDPLGIIENTGMFVNNQATISNGGIIKNSLNGKIDNSTGSNIYNNLGGTIYNYNGGIIDTNGYFQNNGIINNADGTSTCGIGIINGSIVGNVPGNLCP